MINVSETIKHIVDALMAIIAGVGLVLTSVVSFCASAAALTWYGIRIYEWRKARKNGIVKLD